MTRVALLAALLILCGCVSPGAPRAVRETIKREQVLYSDLKSMQATVEQHVEKQNAQAEKPDEVRKEEAEFKAEVIPQIEKGKDDIVKDIDKLKEAEIIETKKEEGTNVVKWIAIAGAAIGAALLVMALKKAGKLGFLGF